MNGQITFLQDVHRVLVEVPVVVTGACVGGGLALTFGDPAGVVVLRPRAPFDLARERGKKEEEGWEGLREGKF
jgi:hypothetical protein